MLPAVQDCRRSAFGCAANRRHQLHPRRENDSRLPHIRRKLAAQIHKTALAQRMDLLVTPH